MELNLSSREGTRLRKTASGSGQRRLVYSPGRCFTWRWQRKKEKEEEGRERKARVIGEAPCAKKGRGAHFAQKASIGSEAIGELLRTRKSIGGREEERLGGAFNAELSI